jgi:hypothetical protein
MKMKTIKIKAYTQKNGFKNYEDLHNIAMKKFEKELKDNPNLMGLLLYNIDKAIDDWDSTKEYYEISL